MRRYRRRARSYFYFSAITLTAGLCAGCGSTATSTAPLPIEPTVTPTVTVGFAVDVTPAPALRQARPRPTATVAPFSAPKTSAAWLVLSPSSGPPISRIITVWAGNLPARTPVVMSWSSLGRGAPLTTSTETGPRGNLATTFSTPNAQPGVYRLSIVVQGEIHVSARYHIVSPATITVRAMPSPDGDTVVVSGRRFLSRAALLLVAYPVVRGHAPVMLGTVHADTRGRFRARIVSQRLQPGDYVLRAWSVGLLESETAEAFFQVVV